MHVVSQEHGLHLAMYYPGQKSIYLLILCPFDHLLQIGQIHCLVYGFLPVLKVLLTNMPRTGPSSIHSRKLKVHLFHFL